MTNCHHVQPPDPNGRHNQNPNPKRQHILDDVRNNPGRVRIVTDTNGDQYIDIGAEDGK